MPAALPAWHTISLFHGNNALFRDTKEPICYFRLQCTSMPNFILSVQLFWRNWVTSIQTFIKNWTFIIICRISIDKFLTVFSRFMTQTILVRAQRWSCFVSITSILGLRVLHGYTICIFKIKNNRRCTDFGVFGCFDFISLSKSLLFLLILHTSDI